MGSTDTTTVSDPAPDTVATGFPAAVRGVTAQLNAVKEELARINGQIEHLQVTRLGVTMAPPHTDDIVASYQRGLAGTVRAFRRQLSDNLAATFLGDKAADAAVRSSDVMTMPAQVPSAEDRLTSSLRGTAPGLNTAAVTYFLRGQIEAEIPHLVDSLFPASRQGMKASERVEALKTIDAEISVLTKQAEDLAAGIAAIRTAARR